MTLLSRDLVFEEMHDDHIAAVFPEDVKDAVELIRTQADSVEPDADYTAHQMESFLHRNVLRYVETGLPGSQELARLALTSERIGFRRGFE